MTRNHESHQDMHNEDESLRLRDKRFKRALAGLIIGGGVLAAGTYITLDYALNKNSDDHSTTQEQPSDSDIPVPDSWPEFPKTPLPPPEILDQSEWGIK